MYRYTRTSTRYIESVGLRLLHPRRAAHGRSVRGRSCSGNDHQECDGHGRQTAVRSARRALEFGRDCDHRAAADCALDPVRDPDSADRDLAAVHDYDLDSAGLAPAAAHDYDLDSAGLAPAAACDRDPAAPGLAVNGRDLDRAGPVSVVLLFVVLPSAPVSACPCPCRPGFASRMRRSREAKTGPWWLSTAS